MGLVEVARQWIAPKPRISFEELSKAKPVRNPAVVETPGEEGVLLLQAPLMQQGRGFAGWMAKRMNAPDTKTFELEPVGAFVWTLCDGKHTVEAISRKLRDRYKMNRLEADAALNAFLQMLGQRRLITLTTGKKK
ncbi:PqqD family protein [Fimbriimonas ginsengisoli]|uniref:PqqD family protein n=1 Tax=Fimbriimonas ginsengisoli Gsoil 348 TaxID=661478 RepID=A0A068NWL1_FIMGI|nr:PqqD family protein [Fimbriimonas ginsengisoli]AIE87836.1 hypothetical protein OP10G_4468 [Fimbriimonas ginsengisoli Gsoil 348]